METLIITTEQTLEDVIYRVMHRIEKDNRKKSLPETMSVHAFAKKVKKAHRTVSTMAKKGIIKTTPDGRIYTSELDKFFI